MKRFSKSIGIVGGAGPIASAFLYSSILEFCQKNYGANDYNEFPEILLLSYPFSRNVDEIRVKIKECIERLEKGGASLVSVASHSFHAFLPEHLSNGFVSIVHESIQEAKARGIKKALILGSETTKRLRIYEGYGIECVYSHDQPRVNQLIREVAGGKIDKHQSEQLNEMFNDSVDGVILACTELPVIHKHFPLSGNVIDTVEVLSSILVQRSL